MFICVYLWLISAFGSLKRARVAALAVALSALAVCAPAAVPSAPQVVSAHYDVFRNGGHVAVINETFQAKDGGYRIVSETRAVGLLALFVWEPLRVVSSGQLTASGLRPQRFEGKRSDDDPRKARANFDWQAEQLTITHRGKTNTLRLPPATQDMLSAMYQFMFLEHGKVQRYELSMTNGRKLEHYLYVVERNIEIDTPLGRMTTLRFVKQRAPDEGGIEIWLAPQYRHLPVRLRIEEEDGSRYEQVITRLEVTP